MSIEEKLDNILRKGLYQQNGKIGAIEDIIEEIIKPLCEDAFDAGEVMGAINFKDNGFIDIAQSNKKKAQWIETNLK